MLMVRLWKYRAGGVCHGGSSWHLKALTCWSLPSRLPFLTLSTRCRRMRIGHLTSPGDGNYRKHRTMEHSLSTDRKAINRSHFSGIGGRWLKNGGVGVHGPIVDGTQN